MANENEEFNYIEKFIQETKTDIALSMYYLQNSAYDYKTAIKLFNKSDHIMKEGFHVPTNKLFDDDKFTILSWNIDGTEPKELSKRIQKVCQCIKRINSQIVYFQELTVECVDLLKVSLETDYLFYTEIDVSTGPYFSGIIINKNVVVLEDSFEIIPLQNSVSKRSLLKIEVVLKTIRIRLMTAHLESTAQFSDCRKTQLKQIFKEITGSNKYCIFGGDCNLRENEINEIGIPNNTVDIWEFTGRRKEATYTWDPRRNINASHYVGTAAKPQRFDRMYFFCRNKNQDTENFVIRPVYFELEGIEKVNKGSRFPSDHWAILTHFNIEES